VLAEPAVLEEMDQREQTMLAAAAVLAAPEVQAEESSVPRYKQAASSVKIF
jgi:hypothetical protein